MFFFCFFKFSVWDLGRCFIFKIELRVVYCVLCLVRKRELLTYLIERKVLGYLNVKWV